MSRLYGLALSRSSFYPRLSRAPELCIQALSSPWPRPWALHGFAYVTQISRIGFFNHSLFKCNSQTTKGFRQIYLHSFPPRLKFSELMSTPTKMLTLFGIYAGIIIFAKSSVPRLSIGPDPLWLSSVSTPCPPFSRAPKTFWMGSISRPYLPFIFYSWTLSSSCPCLSRDPLWLGPMARLYIRILSLSWPRPYNLNINFYGPAY